MGGRIILALTCFLLGALAEASTSGATPAPGSGDELFTAVLMGGSTAGADGRVTVNVGDVFTIPISSASAPGSHLFPIRSRFQPDGHQSSELHRYRHRFRNGRQHRRRLSDRHTGFIDNSTGVLSGVADSLSGLRGAKRFDEALKEMEERKTRLL